MEESEHRGTYQRYDPADFNAESLRQNERIVLLVVSAHGGGLINDGKGNARLQGVKQQKRQIITDFFTCQTVGFDSFRFKGGQKCSHDRFGNRRVGLGRLGSKGEKQSGGRKDQEDRGG